MQSPAFSVIAVTIFTIGAVSLEVGFLDFTRKIAVVIAAIFSTASLGFILTLIALLRRSRIAETDAASNAAFVSTLLDTVGVRIVACDANGIVTRANHEVESRFGTDLVGRPQADMPYLVNLFESDGTTLVDEPRTPLRRALNGEVLRDVEFVWQGPDGSEKVVQINANAVHNSDGSVAGAVVAWNEVTELRQATNRLKTETDRLTQLVAVQRSIVRGADDFNATVNAAAQWAHRLSGGDGAVLELVDGSDMVYEGAIGSVADQIGLRLPRNGSLSGLTVKLGNTQNCRDTHTDDRVNREATNRLNIRSMAIAPVGHRGNVIGALKILSSQPNAFDDTAVLKLELVADAVGSALAVSRLLTSTETQRQTFEVLLNSLSEMGEGVTMGEGDRIIYANEAFCKLLGYSSEELLQMETTSSLVVTDEAFSDLVQQRNAIMEGKGVGRLETTLRTRDDEPIPVETTTQRIITDGKIQRISVVRDIRLRREWEESLAEQAQMLLRTNDELKALEAMRADFLAAVSHDFRTPLTSIVGFLHLVLDTEQDQPISTVTDFLKRIERGCEELQRRIETFLDFSRVERTGITLECESDDVSKIVTEVVEDLRPAIREHTIELIVAPSCLALIESRSLTRVVENLLTNAAKYSPADTPIVVKVDAQATTIHISVIDQGSGIGTDDLEKIFDSYYRASDVRGTIRGSGIGLAVARQLVEAMGGRIWAQNNADVGSMFSVELQRSSVEATN